MNYSGILVVTTSDNLTSVRDALNALEGVEVHHTDESTARIIAVQEAENVKQEVAGLRTIKQLPGVVMAEMVNHYFGDTDEAISPDELPDDLDAMTGLQDSVPAYLNE